MHWKVDAQILRTLVPSDLEIDLHEGDAWVSLVAFSMEKIRPRFLPAFPLVSNFNEINLRTYIKDGDKTGVYFLSIEGGKWMSCAVSKAISGLPYRYSKMHRDKGLYSSNNDKFGDLLQVRYEIGDPVVKKEDLDKWLTERYALFQDNGQEMNTFEVHHVEWPVHHLEINDLKVQYNRFGNLLSPIPDRVQYSPGVQVLAWNKTVKDRSKH